MRFLLAATLVLTCLAASCLAGPLALYDTSRDATALAPLPPAAPPATTDPAPPLTTLPFEVGGSVSGMVGGISHVGAVSGEAASAWVRGKDVPVELYLGFERLQPIGR